MAEEKNAEDRFGWTDPSDVLFEDDDGNMVRVAPIPPESQKILDEHAEELKKRRAAKAKDARMKQHKSIQVHIHRK